MAQAAYAETGPQASPPKLTWLVFVSLLAMLNLPFVFTLYTGIDQYGYFSFDWVGPQPWPLALASVTSSFQALLATALYVLLWNWRYSASRERRGVFGEAALVVVAPLFLAHAPSILFIPDGEVGNVAIVAILMFVTLFINTIVKDPVFEIDPREAVVWFSLAAAFILILLVLAMATTLISTYIAYTTEVAPADGSLARGWEVDWSKLGYGAEQLEYAGAEHCWFTARSAAFTWYLFSVASCFGP